MLYHSFFCPRNIAQFSALLKGEIDSGKDSLFLNVNLSQMRESSIFFPDTAYLLPLTLKVSIFKLS